MFYDYNLMRTFYRKIIGEESESSAEGSAGKRLQITHKTAYQLMRQQNQQMAGGLGGDEVRVC